MLNTFRNHATGWMAKLMLGLLILSFAAWGIPDLYQAINRSATVAKAGSTTITMPQFERALQRDLESIKQTLGSSYNMELIKSLGFHRQILERMINDVLLSEEAQNVGLTPSDADMARLIHADLSFRNAEGKFDKKLFQAALAQGGMSESYYINELKKNARVDMLMAGVTALSPVSDIAVQTLHAARNEKRTADLFVLSVVQEIPKPTEEDLQSYYKTHTDQFATPELRQVSYVVIEEEDDKKLQSKANTLEDELAAGSTLEEAAKKLSLTLKRLAPMTHEGKTAEGKEAGAPGFPNFLVLAFKTDENTDSSAYPANDKNKLFVLHVDSVTPPGSKPFEQVKSAVREGWEKEARSKALAAIAEHINRQLQENPALELKLHSSYTPRPTGPITRGSTKTDSGETLPPELVKELFELRTDYYTRAYPRQDGSYVIARLRTITSPKPLSGEALKKDSEAELIRETLASDMRQELQTQYLAYLRAKYGVRIDEQALNAALERP